MPAVCEVALAGDEFGFSVAIDVGPVEIVILAVGGVDDVLCPRTPAVGPW